MKQTKIKFNIGSLNNLRAELAAEYKAKVGVIGSKAVRASDTGGFNNAEIGIVHEMGSEYLGIPARSFLRMPLEMKRKELVIFARKNGHLIEQGKIKEFFALIGIKAEQIIQNAFATRGYGQWDANAESTIKAKTVNGKKGDTPLIDTGELRKSISSEVINAN